MALRRGHMICRNSHPAPLLYAWPANHEMDNKREYQDGQVGVVTAAGGGGLLLAFAQAGSRADYGACVCRGAGGSAGAGPGV